MARPLPKSGNPALEGYSIAFLKKIRGIILSLFLLTGLAIWWIWQFSYSFLTLNKPICDPEAIIVEGWLPIQAISQVADEVLNDSSLKIIVTGASLGHEHVTLGEHPDGAWTVYLDRLFADPILADSLSFFARGNKIDGKYGELRIEINNRLVGIVFVREQTHKVVFANPNGANEPIKKIEVQMQNTYFPQEGGSRLVYLEQVFLDSIPVELFGPSTGYSFSHYQIGRFETILDDNAAIAAGNVLEKLGIPPERLVVLPSNASKGTRTWEAAKEVGRWLESSSHRIERVRLYSQGAHSRRSYEIYRKILPDSIYLGVNALKDERYDENWASTSFGRRLLAEQLIKYLYYKILFIR